MATRIKLVLNKSIEKFRPEIKYCAYLLESLYDVEFVTRNEDKIRQTEKIEKKIRDAMNIVASRQEDEEDED